MNRCPCGIKSCVNGSAKTHEQRLRARVKGLDLQNAALDLQNAALERWHSATLPTLERCEEVERQVRQFNLALEHWKNKSRLRDVDLSQRYILIQELGLKLAKLIGPAQAEAFIRSAVPAPFVRTLGPLDGIFKAMHANELAGQAANAAPELPLPDGFYPKLIEFKGERDDDD